MKLTKSLALSLTVVVLLAVGAIGFADKTEELQNNASVSSTTAPAKRNSSPAKGNSIKDHKSKPPKYEAGEEHNMDDM